MENSKQIYPEQCQFFMLLDNNKPHDGRKKLDEKKKLFVIFDFFLSNCNIKKDDFYKVLFRYESVI